MSDDLALMPASRLVALYREKELSPVEVALAALDRIAAADGVVNAFCLVEPEDALAQARESESRWRKGAPKGLVDGVPTSIKDLVLTKGWPTLRGSRAISPDQAWDEDAPATARLREHGAVLIGKTTTPEFGWKGVTDSPLTGVTRNPWDPSRTPGGSSGGGAAGVALGMGALAIGSDAGGSIRIPCAFCGVYGLKPAYGRVPAHPISLFGTIAHVGPIARTVADAALMLTVIAGPDARDWTALAPEGRNYLEGLEDGVKGLRVAYSPDLGYAEVGPEVAAPVRQAVEAFEELGAVVEEVGRIFDDPLEPFLTHFRVGAAKIYRGLGEEQRAVLDPGFRRLAEEGLEVGLEEYLAAMDRRAELGRTMSLFMAAYDLLMTPQMPLVAFEAGADYPRSRGLAPEADWSPFTYPFNLTQSPAAAVPCGFAADGLPVALQIVGRRYDDATVLQASRAFEAVHPFKMPPLPKAEDSP